MTKKISVLLLAQNSEKTLRRCLESLCDFDEVVLIDGGSQDNTIQIAKSYPNVVVFENPWPGFIEQRNFSISKAKNEWCFMIDSDEAISKELSDYLHTLPQVDNPIAMYRMVRTEYFEGRPIETGFGKSDFQERYFKKDRVSYTGGVHHGHLIDGKGITPDDPRVESLPRHLRIFHCEEYGMDEWLLKFPRFSILIAHEKLERGKTTNALLVLLAFIGTFFQIYAKSWRNGRLGFVIAVQEAINRCMIKLYIYNKMHIARNKQSDEVIKQLG